MTYIFLYALIGIGYMIYLFFQNKLPYIWSPIQPLSMIFGWPLMVGIDIVNKIKNKIKP